MHERPVRRQRFDKSLRLRKRHEFLAVQRRAVARRRRHFVWLAAERRDDGPSRIGITVSRRVGNAVVRNRIKRRVREVFRKNRHLFPSRRDFVFIARTGVHVLTSSRLEQEILAAAKEPA